MPPRGAPRDRPARRPRPGRPSRPDGGSAHWGRALTSPTDPTRRRRRPGRGRRAVRRPRRPHDRVRRRRAGPAARERTPRAVRRTRRPRHAARRHRRAAARPVRARRASGLRVVEAPELRDETLTEAGIADAAALALVLRGRRDQHQGRARRPPAQPPAAAGDPALQPQARPASRGTARPGGAPVSRRRTGPATRPTPRRPSCRTPTPPPPRSPPPPSPAPARSSTPTGCCCAPWSGRRPARGRGRRPRPATLALLSVDHRRPGRRRRLGQQRRDGPQLLPDEASGRRGAPGAARSSWSGLVRRAGHGHAAQAAGRGRAARRAVLAAAALVPRRDLRRRCSALAVASWLTTVTTPLHAVVPDAARPLRDRRPRDRRAPGPPDPPTPVRSGRVAAAAGAARRRTGSARHLPHGVRAAQAAARALRPRRAARARQDRHRVLSPAARTRHPRRVRRGRPRGARGRAGAAAAGTDGDRRRHPGGRPGSRQDPPGRTRCSRSPAPTPPTWRRRCTRARSTRPAGRAAALRRRLRHRRLPHPARGPPAALTRSRSVSTLAAPAFAGAMMGRQILGAIPVERRVLLFAALDVAGHPRLEGRTVGEVFTAGTCRILALDRPAERRGSGTPVPPGDHVSCGPATGSSWRSPGVDSQNCVGRQGSRPLRSRPPVRHRTRLRSMLFGTEPACPIHAFGRTNPHVQIRPQRRRPRRGRARRPARLACLRGRRQQLPYSQSTAVGVHNAYDPAAFPYLADGLGTGTGLIELDIWTNLVGSAFRVSHDPVGNNNNCTGSTTAAGCAPPVPPTRTWRAASRT